LEFAVQISASFSGHKLNTCLQQPSSHHDSGYLSTMFYSLGQLRSLVYPTDMPTCAFYSF
jgi:hypothetical protein